MEQKELSREYADGIAEAFKSGGIMGVKQYVNQKKDRWKHIPLSIAVTGRPGVGKSCFINTFRNVKRGEPLFAEENVKESTTKPTPYQHPEHRNLVLWDLPGVGTDSFPKESYLQSVNLLSYDFYLIISSERFTKKDIWLANEIKRAGKRFFYVRSQVDCDCLKRNDLEETEVLEIVRSDCKKRFQEKGYHNVEELLFLINGKDTHKYDFNRLTKAILEMLPSEKREALALSLTTRTEEVIRAKISALRNKIYLVAILSAIGAATPIPGAGLMVDYTIISEEVKEYKKQLGLDDETLGENARALGTTMDQLKERLDLKSLIISSSLRSLAAFCSTVALSEPVENAAKFVVPIIGSVIAAGLSYGSTVVCLRSLLNTFSEDALKVNAEMVRMLSTTSSA